MPALCRSVRKQMPTDPQQAAEFAQSKGQARKEGRTGVTFDDVAGLEPIVTELQRVSCGTLQNPKQYSYLCWPQEPASCCLPGGAHAGGDGFQQGLPTAPAALSLQMSSKHSPAAFHSRDPCAAQPGCESCTQQACLCCLLGHDKQVPNVCLCCAFSGHVAAGS